MDKIKAKLSKIKEDIECCENRERDAKALTAEAKARLEAAETEKASFERRIKLLRKDVEKTKENVLAKQERLDGLESKTAEDESVVKTLETQEVEGDEELDNLSDLLRQRQTVAEDMDLQWREAKRKLLVLQQDLERADKRFESSSLRIEEATDKLDTLGSMIKSLEDRENDQCERETENEQKLAFLGEQDKEALVRAENAERDCVRLGHVVDGLETDIKNWHNKTEGILAEIASLSSLAEDI